MTKVVNIKKDKCDVYIGRKKDSKYHFGNIATHKDSTLAPIKVATRKLAIQAYKDWLEGIAYKEIEPERRQWILDNIHTLHDKTLGCFCKPLACHGDILAEMADKL
jgi:hypothetical protein